MNISDRSLISHYKEGHEKAFEELVERHKSSVFSVIYSVVQNQSTAEDILQETFIKVVKSIRSGKYKEKDKFLIWLLRVAHNLAIDHYRKNSQHRWMVLESGELANKLGFVEDSAESKYVEQDIKMLLRHLIDELPKEQREVLIMRHYMHMSFQEISELTSVSISTALGRMRYALKNLRKKIQKRNIYYKFCKQ